MKHVTVVATFQARSGKEAALREALIGLLEPTRKEPGCISYDMHSSPDDPAKFLFYETWQSKDALDAHMRTPHFQKLVPRVEDLCVAFPQITLWEKVS
jgi:quinol monooxygenase YgiN